MTLAALLLCPGPGRELLRCKCPGVVGCKMRSCVARTVFLLAAKQSNDGLSAHTKASPSGNSVTEASQERLVGRFRSVWKLGHLRSHLQLRVDRRGPGTVRLSTTAGCLHHMCERSSRQGPGLISSRVSDLRVHVFRRMQEVQSKHSEVNFLVFERNCGPSAMDHPSEVLGHYDRHCLPGGDSGRPRRCIHAIGQH